MAVTKIWDVKSHLSSLVAYVSNTQKTVEHYSEDALNALVEYGINDLKTEERKYVTAVNCKPDSAAGEIARLNGMTSSFSKTVAYHGYQSFAPGEVDAETAHKIGVSLANELWGENFPVVVATHLDRGHIHNHFAIGATGFDGRRYHDCKETYRLMRQASDRLCREYGLSIVKETERGRTRHIGEVKAEEEGRPTVRGLIRRDMDIAIKHCFTYPQFVSTFQTLGYTMEWRGKYLRIRSDHGKKFFRMDKLGEGYTYEDVQERLRENARLRRIIPYEPYQPKEKPKGLYALYIHYCYLLGELPKQRPSNREAYAVIKEDVRRARQYSEEAKLLGKYGINTAEELSSFTDRISKEFNSLAYERGKLRNKLRRMTDTAEMQPIKDDIARLSLAMADLRKQMKLCKDIAMRSGVIEKVIDNIGIPDKEVKKQKNKTEREERK